MLNEVWSQYSIEFYINITNEDIIWIKNIQCVNDVCDTKRPYEKLCFWDFGLVIVWSLEHL